MDRHASESVQIIIGNYDFPEKDNTMKNDTTTTAATDIESNFLNEISIWNLIGNQPVVSKLRILSMAYHNDKSEHREPHIKPIIICGPKSTGRTVLSHAYANSIGSSQLFQMDGIALSISYFLDQGDEFSSYLINNADKMTAYTSQIISDVISRKELTIYNPFDRENIRKEPFHKLLMIGVNDLNKIGAELVKKCEVCFLKGFSSEEVFQMLNQRILFLNWEIESEKVLENIVSVCKRKVALAIDILGWTYRVARSEGVDVMKEKHLNLALHLLQRCEGNK